MKFNAASVTKQHHKDKKRHQKKKKSKAKCCSCALWKYCNYKRNIIYLLLDCTPDLPIFFRRNAEVSKLAPCEGLGSKEQKLWSIFQRSFVPPFTEAGPYLVNLLRPLMRGLYRQVRTAVGRISPGMLFFFYGEGDPGSIKVGRAALHVIFLDFWEKEIDFHAFSNYACKESVHFYFSCITGEWKKLTSERGSYFFLSLQNWHINFELDFYETGIAVT